MAEASLTIGVDEAGRGAVLGPMVLAACGLTRPAAVRLQRAGVADSKTFGPPPQARGRRAALASLVRAEATYLRIAVLSAEEIDVAVASNGLNALERTTALRLLADAPEQALVVLDGYRLFAPLARDLPAAIALDRAEEREVAVAAASLLAKVERDAQFTALAARYAAFGLEAGGGYPNTPTARFLCEYFERHGRLPDEARRRWRWAPLLRLLGTGPLPPEPLLLPYTSDPADPTPSARGIPAHPDPPRRGAARPHRPGRVRRKKELS